MENLETRIDKKEIVEEFFKWLFDKENIELVEEIDLSLARTYYDSNIYYTKEILDFFNTRAMKRLEKISQLGTIILQNSNCYHNRLEHSKGTYNRKLEELIYLTSDIKYKKFIEENNLKQYLIAELIKVAAHDIGHLPLSHVLEVTIVGKRGYHEDIGKRILLEDKEINVVLEKIYPNLKDYIEKLITEDVLSFNSHDEGNYDVDRLDYILRDYLYYGIMLKDYSHEHYKAEFAKTDENGNIERNKDGSIVLLSEEEQKSNIPRKQIDVYENTSLKSIEEFLETRVQAYKNLYFSGSVQVEDFLVGIFINCILSEKENIAQELICFINNLKEKKNNVDLEEYLKWDDIRFYRNCMEIAEKSENENLRKVAGLLIPNLIALMNITFSHLDLKNSRKNNYASISEHDKDFIKKIKQIINSDTSLSQMLKNNEYYNDNCLLCDDDEKIKRLKEQFGDKLFYSKVRVSGYSNKVPIYIKDKIGRIYPLHEHPERRCNWLERREEVRVAFSFIPFLKMQGISDEQIEEIKKCFGRTTTNETAYAQGEQISMYPFRAGTGVEKIGETWFVL